MTMALISLRGCAGWSAPSLFTNFDDMYSRAETQLLFTSYVTCAMFSAHLISHVCFTHFKQFMFYVSVSVSSFVGNQVFMSS